MPTYTIRNKQFGTEKDVLCSYSELQEMLKSDDIEQVLSAPALVGDHVVKRMDGGMKEVFSKIGTEVLLSVRGKYLPAKIVNLPFVSPKYFRK